jgi:hypothetical protein
LRKTTWPLLWILSTTALYHKHFWLQNCDGWCRGWEMLLVSTAYMIRKSITSLQGMFPGCFISCFGNIHWQPCCQDLTVPHFALWEYLRPKVYWSVLLLPIPPKTSRTALRRELKQLTALHCSDSCNFQQWLWQCTERHGDQPEQGMDTKLQSSCQFFLKMCNSIYCSVSHSSLQKSRIPLPHPVAKASFISLGSLTQTIYLPESKT